MNTVCFVKFRCTCHATRSSSVKYHTSKLTFSLLFEFHSNFHFSRQSPIKYNKLNLFLCDSLQVNHFFHPLDNQQWRHIFQATNTYIDFDAVSFPLAQLYSFHLNLFFLQNTDKTNFQVHKHSQL